MQDVTLVQTQGRGKAFWLGLVVGIVAMLLAVVIMWLLGVIDVGRKSGANATTSSANASNNTAISVNGVSGNNTSNNATLDNVANNIANEAAQQADVSPFFADAVLARNVDSQARPVDETSTFAKGDARFYVVVMLKDSIPAGTKVGVEWLQNGNKQSDYATEVTKGQTVAYFFTNNPGKAGDYSVRVLIDGKVSSELKFVVQ